MQILRNCFRAARVKSRKKDFTHKLFPRNDLIIAVTFTWFGLNHHCNHLCMLSQEPNKQSRPKSPNTLISPQPARRVASHLIRSNIFFDPLKQLLISEFIRPVDVSLRKNFVRQSFNRCMIHLYHMSMR